MANLGGGWLSVWTVVPGAGESLSRSTATSPGGQARERGALPLGHVSPSGAARRGRVASGRTRASC